MDEELMLEWCDKVWKPFIDSKQSESLFYLSMDEFSAHMTPKVLNRFSELNTMVDFVVGGYTAKLQVLDVGINKPSKNFMRREYENFMLTNETQKPLRNHVSHWVSTAWSEITVANIKNTWKKLESVFQIKSVKMLH